MASVTRFKTRYAGVFYIEGKSVGSNKKEKIYYIRYRRDGKMVEEKAGRQYIDDMTPARAAGIRSQRIEGKQVSNTEKRELARKRKITIQVLADEYFSQKADTKATRTDKGRYKNYLMVPFGAKEPKQIVSLDINRLRINLSKKRSPQTTKHVVALLHRIINFGINHGLTPPLSFKITLPKVDNIKTEDLAPDELQRLIEVLDTTPHQTAANIMKMALFTGMRRGEIFKLKWADIDLHRGFIHIRDPKGGKSQKIPINSNTRDLLNAISMSDKEYVFPARGGGPRKDIAKDVREIKKSAGLPDDFRPLHGLRHLYATMLASSGKVDMIALQKLLTHKDQRMTQRYMHYRDEALHRAAEEVGNILDDAMKPIAKKDVA